MNNLQNDDSRSGGAHDATTTTSVLLHLSSDTKLSPLQIKHFSSPSTDHHYVADDYYCEEDPKENKLQCTSNEEGRMDRYRLFSCPSNDDPCDESDILLPFLPSAAEETHNRRRPQLLNNNSKYSYGQENDEGHIEYKWRLLELSDDRLEHLTTQMKFRLAEGSGEAIYCLGVTDEGTLLGLPSNEMSETLQNLTKMANRLGARLRVEKEIQGVDGTILEVVVSSSTYTFLKHQQIGVVVVGEKSCGKSTLIGSLVTGIVDDGNGLARTLVFRHRHELLDGHTSSVAAQSLSFDSNGNALTLMTSEKLNRPYTPSEDADIIKSSCKIVSLIDLAGDERYRKSMLRGLTSAFPDAFLIVHRLTNNQEVAVGSRDSDRLQTTQEYLLMAQAMECSSLIALVGTDEVLEECVQKGERQIRKIAKKLNSLSTTSIIKASAVSGDGLDILRKELQLLKPLPRWSYDANAPPIYVIQEVFRLVDGTDLVVGGILLQGSVNDFDILHCGPFPIQHHRRSVSTMNHQRKSASLNSNKTRDQMTTEIPCLNKNDMCFFKCGSQDKKGKEVFIPYHDDIQFVPKCVFAPFDENLPFEGSLWRRVQISSIHTNRIPVQHVKAQQPCSFALKIPPSNKNNSSISKNVSVEGGGAASSEAASNVSSQIDFSKSLLRPGMVLMGSLEAAIKATGRHIAAKIRLLPSSKRLDTQSIATCQKKSQVTLFVQCLKQRVYISKIQNDSIEPGKTGYVEIELMNSPEVVLVKMPCVIWGDGIKGCGIIVPSKKS